MKMPTAQRLADGSGNPTPAWLQFFNNLATAVALSEADDLDSMTAELDVLEDELESLEEDFDDVDRIYNRLIFSPIVMAKSYVSNASTITIQHNIFDERPANVIRQNQTEVYADEASSNYGAFQYHVHGWNYDFDFPSASIPPMDRADTPNECHMYADRMKGIEGGGGTEVRGDNTYSVTPSLAGTFVITLFIPSWFLGVDVD